MVNEEFARRVFGGNAIGKRIRLQDDNKGWAEIVGITTTGKYNVITEPPQMHVYMPFRQNPIARMTLIAETAGAPASATGLLRDAIGSIDPNMPIFSVRTIEEVFQRGAVSQVRIFNVGSASRVSWGSYSPSLDSMQWSPIRSPAEREIGVRIAVGAQRSQVVRMILKQAEIVAGIGVGIGVLFSIAARPALMMSMGQRASSFDPLTISIIPLSLLLITLLAAAIPARRAAQVDPQRALRQD